MLTGWAWSILSLFARFDFGASLPTHVLHHTQPRSKNPPVFIKWHKNAPVCAALNLEASQRLQLLQGFEFFFAISIKFSTSQAQLAVVQFLPQICYEFGAKPT